MVSACICNFFNQMPTIATFYQLLLNANVRAAIIVMLGLPNQKSLAERQKCSAALLLTVKGNLV